MSLASPEAIKLNSLASQEAMKLATQEAIFREKLSLLALHEASRYLRQKLCSSFARSYKLHVLASPEALR